MNKMNSKKILAAFLVLGFVFSLKALAANNNQGAGNSRADVAKEKQADKKDQKVENLCAKISDQAEKFSAKAAQQEEKIRNRQEERLNNWEEKSSQVETDLTSRRETWDANRDEQFDKLEDQAQTEEQKKALEAFKSTVRTAMATRRSAMDAAIKTFHDGVQSAVRTRQGQIDQLVSDSKSARQTALNKAEEACENGSDLATVRATLRTSLQAAKGKVSSDKQEAVKVGSTIQALIQARKTAFEKAKSDFKATMEQARVELRKAFPAEMETE